MTDEEKRVPACFYRTAGGAESARDWLKCLTKQDRKIIGTDIKTAEYGWPLGMPLCRSISSHKGLWEIRSNLSGKRISRVLFCTHDNQLVLLHGFIKKSQKTPRSDLDLAKERMKKVRASVGKKKKEKKK